MIASHKIGFNEDQIAYILENTEKVLRSGNVVLGIYTESFEYEYARHCDRSYGVAVSSDTAAFEMQLKTLGVEGEVVLYPALAFPSILESVFNAGATPYFIDADLNKHLFCGADVVEKAILEVIDSCGKPPKALILMHTGGLLALESEAIEAICHDYGVTVLEDAAHAFGARLDGRVAGNFGKSSAFSLYATKPMHSMEGGMIVTDDMDLADECKIYRNYGRMQNFGRSRIIRHGYSWRMTELQAIVGLANLSWIDANIARRQQIMAMYDEMIDSASENGTLWIATGRSAYAPWRVQKLLQSPGMESCGYRYILLLPTRKAQSRGEDIRISGTENRLKRDRLKARMHEFGVDLPGEVYELPSHKQPIWPEYRDKKFPVAEDFCARHFALPVYPSLTDGDVEQIFNAATKALMEVLA